VHIVGKTIANHCQMKRRKFLTATAATTLAAPLSMSAVNYDQQQDREIYELRTYEMAWGSDSSPLMTYLQEVEGPFLKANGANHFMMFKEISQTLPNQQWTLTSFPNLSVYHQCVANRYDEAFVAQSQSYAKAGKTFNRISSSLLRAFEGIKQMKEPIENASLFELRIYEGVNEDAVRRKIKMFNHEELDLFYRVDLNPIFFGNMLIGPYVPSLVYMLNYRDMDHRDQAWKDFLEHPDWEAMKGKEEYAGTVSNIRRIYLERS
jgi:hypothetical protein